MLDGEIAYREGRFDEAFAHLRRAIELDDALPYDEPWGWMQPTRHAYGALLLEQGRVEDAAQVYAADLGLDPTLSTAVPAPGQRVEPARLPRVPATAGPRRRGGASSASSWRWPWRARTCRSPRHVRAGSRSLAAADAGRDRPALRTLRLWRSATTTSTASAAAWNSHGRPSTTVTSRSARSWSTPTAARSSRIATGCHGGDATRHPEFAIARWAADESDACPTRADATVYTSGEHCPMCAAAHAWVGLGPHRLRHVERSS